jgi:hypothetical protein
MPKLLDLFRLTFRVAPQQRPFFSRGDDPKPRHDERHAALLAGNYPPDGVDIESVSEYRLASLMQYPHY